MAATPVHVLAISGSLRAASVNTAMLRAAARLAPVGMAFTVFEGLGALPLFNPDQSDAPPQTVLHLFEAVSSADVVLFASPEYAHGITGAMKNALDWLVGFEPFAGQAVAVVNTSDRAHHADAALREVLTTMAAQMVERASVTLPLLGAGLDVDGMVRSEPVSTAIRRMLQALLLGSDSSLSPSFSHPVRPPRS